MATALTLLRARTTARRQSKSSASLKDGTRVVAYSLRWHMVASVFSDIHVRMTIPSSMAAVVLR